MTIQKISFKNFIENVDSWLSKENQKHLSAQIDELIKAPSLLEDSAISIKRSEDPKPGVLYRGTIRINYDLVFDRLGEKITSLELPYLSGIEFVPAVVQGPHLES